MKPPQHHSDRTLPYGLKRLQKAETLHFITFSCFQRLPFLESPGPKDTVEAILEQMRARNQARVYAYVLMPEHVHLLLKGFQQMTSRKLKCGSLIAIKLR